MSHAAVHEFAFLVPSGALRRQLFAGVIAALVAGGLAIAGLLTEQPAAQAPGITPSHLFESGSTLAQLVVLWVYIGIAREAGSLGLKKSCQCLIGLLLVSELYILMVTHVFNPVWQRVLGAVVGVGLLAVVAAIAWPLVVAGKSKMGDDEPSPVPEESANRSTAAKVLAGLAVVAYFLIRLAGKFLARKAVKGVVQWELGTIEAIEGLALLVLFAGLTLWFLASKIRLRHRIGTIVVATAWLELLSVFAMVGFVVWAFVSAIAAVNPAMPDQMVDAVFEAQFAQLVGPAIAAVALWTATTVVVFGTVRGRGCPVRIAAI